MILRLLRKIENAKTAASICLPPLGFFIELLFCAECYYGVLLRRRARGNYARDKSEHHAYYYKDYCAFPRKYCADVIKSREVLNDRCNVVSGEPAMNI